MTKYKIIGTEQESTDEDPVVELRLLKNDGINPALQGKDPNGAWHTILYLDGSGKAGRQSIRGKIIGLLTDPGGYIITY